MALTLPASIQGLVGRRLARLFISDDRTRLVFDTYSDASSAVTRYAYLIGGAVDRIYNHSSMVGRVVTSVEALGPDSNEQYKILIRTDGQDKFGLIYVSGSLTPIGIITEQTPERLVSTEQAVELYFIPEQQDHTDVPTLADTDLGNNPPYKASADGTTYRVEEDDVSYRY